MTTTAVRVAWFTAGAATTATALAASAAWSAFDIAAKVSEMRDRVRMTAHQRATEDQTCAELEAERAILRDADVRRSAAQQDATRKAFRPDLLTVPALKLEDLTVTELIAELDAADEQATRALTGRHTDSLDVDVSMAEYRMWSGHAMSLFNEALRRHYRTQGRRGKPLGRADRLRLEIAITRRTLPHETTTRSDTTA